MIDKILQKAQQIFQNSEEIDTFLRIKLWGEPDNPIWHKLLLADDIEFEKLVISFQTESEKRANDARKYRQCLLKRSWMKTVTSEQKEFFKQHNIQKSSLNRWLDGEPNEKLEKKIDLFLYNIRHEEENKKLNDMYHRFHMEIQ